MKRISNHNRVTCLLDDCPNVAAARGLCRKHYQLALEDDLFLDATGLRKAGAGAPLAFIQRHLNYAGSDCLIWPFARTYKGYGEVRYEGRQWRAHRLMCWLALGAPADPSLEASHTCENGHSGCVNPRHLVWETHYENHQRPARKARTHPDLILE